MIAFHFFRLSKIVKMGGGGGRRGWIWNMVILYAECLLKWVILGFSSLNGASAVSHKADVMTDGIKCWCMHST